MTLDQVVVVGAGRVGLSLARALARSGRAVTVLGRHARELPEPLDPVRTNWAPAVGAAELLLIAVPDDAIVGVAALLAQGGTVTSNHVILHTSGLHDRTVLAPLDGSGAALGSWHPLQTFALANGEPGALAGSPVAIEGDARARSAGRQLGDLLHMRPILEIPVGGKAAYHAAAVFASNYLVVLADIAGRLAHGAGAADASNEIFLPLMRRTLANYATGGAATLTGPISRGDAGSVARHLAVLTGPERELYVLLGREALELAKSSGLDADAAQAIKHLLY